MENTKAAEEKAKKEIEEIAEALAVFIDHSELMKDDLLKAYVELLKERVDKERAEKQMQLNRL